MYSMLYLLTLGKLPDMIVALEISLRASMLHVKQTVSQDHPVIQGHCGQANSE